MEQKKLTLLSEIGEFGLIDRLTADHKLMHKSSIKGVGDDAAVIDAGDHCILVTTDLLVEGIHFNLIYTPLKHLGYKAVAVNLSDIYAMNALPQQITVSIAVSGKFSLEALEELYSGIYMACEKFKVDLVGGDTSSSVTGLTISITAIGTAKKEEIVYRSGAKTNDLICVSGDLGAAYMGLQLLEREKALFEKDPALQPDLEGNDYIIGRQLKPEPREDIIRLLKENGIQPTSMIDISDGLSSEILHICKNSDKACRIYQEKIPIDTTTAMMAGEFNIEPLICALHGGEDYELLFTVPLADFDKVKNLKEIHIIGKIVDK
jgi:thiamine-monophosphate kinase